MGYTYSTEGLELECIEDCGERTSRKRQLDRRIILNRIFKN
jgi:hypothetical protein